MKKFILFLTILSSLGFITYSCVKANETEALHDGRCTGSANCTVCSNCSRCAHCSSGGSCGVCGGGSPKRSFYSATKPKRYTKKENTKSTYTSSGNSSTSNNYSSTKIYNFSSGETLLYVNTDLLNIRKSPSTESEILEKVERFDELIYLETNGSWYKVEVKESGTVGYVYYSLVK